MFSCHMVKHYIFLSTDHSVFPPFLSFPQDLYTVNAQRKKTKTKQYLTSYASVQSDQPSCFSNSRKAMHRNEINEA